MPSHLKLHLVATVTSGLSLPLYDFSTMSLNFKLDDTYGAAFIGVVVAAVLHGVSWAQTLYYYTNQNDTWHLKLTVAVVMIFDVVHQVLITQTIYAYTITDWGNSNQIQHLVSNFVTQIIFTGLTAFIVQSFLTLRIWRLSVRNIYLTGSSAILVVGNLASVIAYVVKAFQFRTITSLTKLKWQSISVNIVTVATDVLIAATLCFLLNHSRNGSQKSDAIINKLIIFTVNTGLLTSLCALASLISILVSGHSFIYISFFFCIGRLYTNSLLATLNARGLLRPILIGNEGTVDTMSISLRDFPKCPAQRQNISIKIDTTQEVAWPERLY